MSRNRWLMLSVVMLLAAANAWRWLSDTSSTPHQLAPSGRTTASDLALTAVAFGESEKPLQRDLFRGAPAPREIPRSPEKAKPAKPEVPSEQMAPSKTPEEIAQEAIRAELANIRLVGVVIKGGRPEAYLVNGDQIHIVRRGDQVGGRLVVESVQEDQAVLAGRDSNVRSTLKILPN